MTNAPLDAPRIDADLTRRELTVGGAALGRVCCLTEEGRRRRQVVLEGVEAHSVTIERLLSRWRCRTPWGAGGRSR